MALHPFISALLEKQKEAGAPALSAGTPADARALVAAGRVGLGEGPDMAHRRDLTIPTRSGGIPGRLLVPRGKVSGLVVYLHGGGWVVGAPDDFDALGRELAFRSECAVLLPDYRLAPEHPFPAALEDAEDTLRFATASTMDLVGAEVPLVVAGDSAGANLATVAVRRLRGELRPVLQVLGYPVTDSGMDTDSYQEFAEGLPLTRQDMAWFFDQYAPEGIRGSEDVSPLRAADLSDLPPALVVTAEHDVLRSEGEAYAARLTEAGVKAEVLRGAGMTHGFLRLHNHVDTAHQAVLDVAAAIRTAVTAA